MRSEPLFERDLANTGHTHCCEIIISPDADTPNDIVRNATVRMLDDALGESPDAEKRPGPAPDRYPAGKCWRDAAFVTDPDFFALAQKDQPIQNLGRVRRG